MIFGQKEAWNPQSVKYSLFPVVRICLPSGNSVSRATWGAFFMRGSEGNVFSGNRVTDSDVGMEIADPSYDNHVLGNSFSVNILGVGVGFGANGSIVMGNQVRSLRWGINLVEVSSSEISQNNIQAGDVGVNLLRGTTLNRITGNFISAQIGVFVRNTRLGANRLGPPSNNFRGSLRPIQLCH